jgi:short-subunit dehydrogenase
MAVQKLYIGIVYLVPMENRETVFWITGASSGIGEALALQLARPGNALILSGRDTEALERVQKKINPQVSVYILPFDLMHISLFPNHVKEALSFKGYVDVLINNAGMSQRAPALETTDAVEQKLMSVNYFAPVALTKALLPHFIERKCGHIVVVSSIAGKFGFALRSSYAAAKHALHGYFEALRLELKDIPVYVTLVCPGRVNTRISFNALKGDGAQHNVLDDGQRQGISAQRCAQVIDKAIRQKKYEVLTGKWELLPVYLRRYFPPLFYWLIKKVNAT